MYHMIRHGEPRVYSIVVPYLAAWDYIDVVPLCVGVGLLSCDCTRVVGLLYLFSVNSKLESPEPTTFDVKGCVTREIYIELASPLGLERKPRIQPCSGIRSTAEPGALAELRQGSRNVAKMLVGEN